MQAHEQYLPSLYKLEVPFPLSSAWITVIISIYFQEQVVWVCFRGLYWKTGKHWQQAADLWCMNEANVRLLARKKPLTSYC